MAKTKKQQKVDEVADINNLSDEQLIEVRKNFRQQLRDKFSKWMEISDEEVTDTDIENVKNEFQEEVKTYQDKTYVIAKTDAAAFAELLQKWNAEHGAWRLGQWKGVITFDKVIKEIIEDIKKNNKTELEVDYSTLMYLYETLMNPAGFGIESARAMAILENYNPDTVTPNNDENYVTYSHILMNIQSIINELTAIDKMLKLKRERINIFTAGVKFDWKISDVAEFIELHNAWVGENVTDDVVAEAAQQSIV